MTTTTLKKTIPASELPQAWQEELQYTPDQRVVVSVEPEDIRQIKLQQLRILMSEMGKEAQAAGLTEEKINEILKEYESSRSH